MSAIFGSPSSYRYFKDRPEWADVTPLKQDESPRGVVRIAYSDAFVDAHDYVRAVMAVDERSPRVLELTAEALQMNAANYSIWAYRRNVLTTLNSHLASEYTFTKFLLFDHPKNYQLWYHLQWLMEQAVRGDESNDPKTVYNRPESKLYAKLMMEFELIREILADDAKNYHAWQYRRWLVDFFSVPVKCELKFCEHMILDDSLNNSAWNHRFYTVIEEGLDDTVFDREMNYAVTQLKSMPHNECACNYLLGLISPLPSTVATSDAKLVHKRLLMVRDAIEDLIENDPDGAGDSPPILALLIDLFHTSLQHRLLKPTPSTESLETLREIADSARNICDRLALELNRVRANYWRYRRDQIEKTMEELT
ncbi:Protein farnesyltransferase/geranylgeranyltransferase type-1 subunit alpha [Echinococcus granulosus]|uniref:Protein farnesyltransferase/geranylgeranyltransferase type-1 subunit alpha n=1 Tax=Echinococcus granulosus TaxID=6210 RepID=U6J7W6_ECHGR|nr:Protein farnesyltransferase/geranylgeranyltransferase type-1 subunit alpha [Echinococcus granulosus]EUB62378.1 Protein farnesyltransferase/geranylgeranyltransferase type-1 subunit alpha [Echinococcus granulosus]KAH9281892.1 Protein farnesyltransferase/geranylgeranyltransferase type-1 subunit alpha [Echinococcus granulosus]CDS18527.1 protein farnesyltransferase alpha subunit [Echinococcus granulosus]